MAFYGQQPYGQPMGGIPMQPVGGMQNYGNAMRPGTGHMPQPQRPGTGGALYQDPMLANAGQFNQMPPQQPSMTPMHATYDQYGNEYVGDAGAYDNRQGTGRQYGSPNRGSSGNMGGGYGNQRYSGSPQNNYPQHQQPDNHMYTPTRTSNRSASPHRSSPPRHHSSPSRHSSSGARAAQSPAERRRSLGICRLLLALFLFLLMACFIASGIGTNSWYKYELRASNATGVGSIVINNNQGIYGEIIHDVEVTDATFVATAPNVLSTMFFGLRLQANTKAKFNLWEKKVDCVDATNGCQLITTNGTLSTLGKSMSLNPVSCGAAGDIVEDMEDTELEDALRWQQKSVCVIGRVTLSFMVIALFFTVVAALVIVVAMLKFGETETKFAQFAGLIGLIALFFLVIAITVYGAAVASPFKSSWLSASTISWTGSTYVKTMAFTTTKSWGALGYSWWLQIGSLIACLAAVVFAMLESATPFPPAPPVAMGTLPVGSAANDLSVNKSVDNYAIPSTPPQPTSQPSMQQPVSHGASPDWQAQAAQEGWGPGVQL